jgi:pyruvate dehydrogenase E2 component (dihydrolipoamide acetyltransferase)
MKEIILPELGEGITQATVAYWHCDVGTRVGKDDDVVEVVTDKAVFNIPAGVDGILKEICVQAGQEASVGSPLARVEF